MVQVAFLLSVGCVDRRAPGETGAEWKAKGDRKTAVSRKAAPHQRNARLDVYVSRRAFRWCSTFVAGRQWAQARSTLALSRMCGKGCDV